MKKFNLLKLACISTLLCGFSLALSAKDIYVSPDGDDTKSGEGAGDAIATFSRALTIAADGDVIYITGFIDITKEPNNPASTSNSDISIDGTTSYVKDDVSYSTWNVKGSNGVKLLNKTLTIIGVDNQTCGFDAKGLSRQIRNDGIAKLITYKNLTFKNGNSVPIADSGAGVYVRNSNVTFEDCIFSNNISTSTTGGTGNGGAVYYSDNQGKKLIFDDCVFKNNSAKNGSALYVISGDLSLDNCVIEDNITSIASSQGGAICIVVYDAIKVAVKNTKIKNNIVLGNGGAIYYGESTNATNPVRNSKISFDACAFISNTGSQGGAVCLNNSIDQAIVDVLFVNSTFYGNLASGNNSGGIAFTNGKAGSKFNITNCTMTENKVTGTSGGAGNAIRFFSTTSAVSKYIYNSIIENNYAKDVAIPNISNYVDIVTQSYTPSSTDLVIKNSFIGRALLTLASDATTNYSETNKINYLTVVDNNISNSFKAKFESPTIDYINSKNCIPLVVTSEGYDFGNAQYLRDDLGITTDQLGVTRDFVAGKCTIGAVEKDKNYVSISPSVVDKGTFNVYQTGSSLTVEGESADNDVLNISLYDVAGKAVTSYSNVIEGGAYKQTINLPSSTLKGVYLVKVRINNSVQSKKVVIK